MAEKKITWTPEEKKNAKNLFGSFVPMYILSTVF